IVRVQLDVSAAPSAVAFGAELRASGTEAEKKGKGFVDGAGRGSLTLGAKDLPPRPPKLLLDGGERHEKLEQTVDLGAGQPKDLGEIKLKVLKGQVTLHLATLGASVTLVRRAGEKKIEKKLPEQLWKTPPVKIDIDPTESWRLIATKKGYDEFAQDLR